MFGTLYSMIGGGLTVLTVAFALMKGGEPERIGAGAYVLSFLGTLIVQDLAYVHGLNPYMATIDVLLLGVFIGLTWKSDRTWPIWAAAFQALVVTSHVLALMQVRPPSFAYLTVLNVAAYGVMVSIIIGTFWAWQERRAAEMR